ncbi:hypothetical protein H4S03_006158 [Coemansia sp. S3946]|nr:hypothetical protein H4S03_006158 [Coemansia sp. S3946]
MSASPTSYRARGPGMLIEMARREAVDFDFTPPQHATASSSNYPGSFDNAPPEMTQHQIKGAFFGLPYAQRYNSRNRSETTVHDLPLASLHIAPATIGYKTAQCSPTRRAGRIQLSLRQTPKLGRAAIKVVDFFQARSRNASDRPDTEFPAAFGDDSVKRYSPRLSRWQMADEEHGCRAKSEFRHTQAHARPAVALQDDKPQDSSTRRARNSTGSTSSAKRNSRVFDILRIAAPPQLHRPQLVTIKRSSDKYVVLPSSL